LVLSGLFLASNAPAFEQTYTITTEGASQAQSKWFGDWYVRDGQSDGILKVGGWGDHYISMIKIPVSIPVPGRYLFKGATLNLYSYGSTRPTTMQKIFWLGPWSQDSTSDHWTLIQNGTYGGTGQVPAPMANGWYSMDVSSEVFWWLNGIYPNYGIGLYPDNIDNRFNYFYSPKGPGGGLSLRPFITIQYEVIPSFKMPLDGSGGKAWRLTVECGGKQFDVQNLSDVDPAHTGRGFYSLDFTHWYYQNGAEHDTTGTDVPILAAAGGVVYEVGTDPDHKPDGSYNPNGCYVRIDHDYDSTRSTPRPDTGYQTTYIHMKAGSIRVAVGDTVTQGQQIGIMGDTGKNANGTPSAKGVHLHVTFYFQNAAGPNYSDSIELNNVLMDGFYLTQYKLGTSWDGSEWRPRQYYSSSNIAH
jgi:murein DD-endopeptidase MepM/ murein hydrolase activator NlpD